MDPTQIHSPVAYVAGVMAVMITSIVAIAAPGLPQDRADRTPESGAAADVTVSPPQDARGHDRGPGAIDYEHAEPMPLPSLPDGASPGQAPGSAPPTGSPGMEPGGTGTGAQSPEQLTPPAPLPDAAPQNKQGNSGSAGTR
jgi:hypothetical protein